LKSEYPSDNNQQSTTKHRYLPANRWAFLLRWQGHVFDNLAHDLPNKTPRITNQGVVAVRKSLRLGKNGVGRAMQNGQAKKRFVRASRWFGWALGGRLSP
jgi:hypothetical protein